MSRFVLLVASQGSERELDPRRKVYSTAALLSVHTDTLGQNQASSLNIDDRKIENESF